MCIYTSNIHSDDTLLTKQNQYGAWYYKSGATIGKIGTNHWKDNENYRGLVFDLEYSGSYMCWASRDSLTDSGYHVKLTYHSGHAVNGEDVSQTVYPQGIYFSCNTYLNNWKMHLNNYVYATAFTDGSGGFCTNSSDILLLNNSTQAGRGVMMKSLRANGKYSTICCYTNRIVFGSTDEGLIDCYNDINMNKYDILNQSDARLKINIEDTSVDALDLINQIEMKEFDWIDTHKHESIGIIAQQLQQIIPDLVHEDVNGKMSVKTNKFIPYLIKAIQELTEYITDGVSMFSARNKWIDPYTNEEKEQFISQHVYDELYRETDNEEAVGEEFYLPIET